MEEQTTVTDTIMTTTADVTMGEDTQQLVRVAAADKDPGGSNNTTNYPRTIDYLPYELRQAIFDNCHGERSILSLAYTCCRFYDVYAKSAGLRLRIREWARYCIILRVAFFTATSNPFMINQRILTPHRRTLTALSEVVYRDYIDSEEPIS